MPEKIVDQKLIANDIWACPRKRKIWCVWDFVHASCSCWLFARLLWVNICISPKGLSPLISDHNVWVPLGPYPPKKRINQPEQSNPTKIYQNSDKIGISLFNIVLGIKLVIGWTYLTYICPAPYLPYHWHFPLGLCIGTQSPASGWAIPSHHLSAGEDVTRLDHVWHCLTMFDFPVMVLRDFATSQFW